MGASIDDPFGKNQRELFSSWTRSYSGKSTEAYIGICEQRPVNVRCYPNNDQIDASQRMQRCANSGHSNRSALAKRRTPGCGALIVKRLRGHSRSLPLPALAEQAGCGETANQPQKMYPYVMRLTLNHDGCD